MKIRLIPEWRRAWKFASIQWSVVGIIVMSVLEGVYQGWLYMPKHIQDRIPNVTTIATILFVIVMLGRLCRAIMEDDNGQKE